MEPPSSRSVEALRRFSSFVNDHASDGRDVLGHKRRYLSRAQQQRYWTRRELLAAQHPAPMADVKGLQRYSLGVFSMLAYCDRVHYLMSYFLSPGLSDHFFPLTGPPNSDKWPPGPISNDLFEKVKENQNLFFPLVFDRHNLSDHPITDDRVLPITEMELLREGEVGEATVYKIKVDPAYNELVEKRADSRQPEQDTFALKVQPSSSFHKNEVTAFTHFRNCPSLNIIEFYGSFIQSGKHCLILEYVDGGNLQNYLQNIPPPETAADRLKFWQSYSGFLKGIHGVHQVYQSTDNERFIGLHGDIKPDNMLLKMGPSGSPYDFIPKVADFGYSHFRRVEADEPDKRGLDRHGNQQYCAPEASHHTRFLEVGSNRIDVTADIFSLGAVTDEVLVWVAFGKDEIAHYFAARKEATDRLDCFRGSGYGGCFHNGFSPLHVIREMHERMREKLPEFDIITRKMLDLVEDKMLLERPNDRLSATDLLKRFDIFYQEAKEKMLPPRPASSLFPSSPIQDTNIASPISANSVSHFDLSHPMTPGPPTNSHDRSLSTITSTSTESAFTNSLPSSPQGEPRRPMSNILDGVYDAEGKHICSLPCEKRHTRPGPAPIATGKSHNVSVALQPHESFSSKSTIPNCREPDLLQRATTQTQPGQGSRDSLSTTINWPHLTLDDLREYRRLKKDPRKMPIPAPLMKNIELLRKYIGLRDQMIYFDDSNSMQRFKLKCEDAFTLISYVAKQVDNNGIEIVFGSRPTDVTKRRNTTPLVKKLKGHKFEEPRDKMGMNLSKFVRKVLIPRLPESSGKDLSVLVFTDGNWGDETERDTVVDAVKQLMGEIVHGDYEETRITLSFAQFGDDKRGKEYLSFLDDCGKNPAFKDKAGNLKKCDNIDSGPINGNICKLMIGSVSPGIDATNGYPDDPVTTSSSSMEG